MSILMTIESSPNTPSPGSRPGVPPARASANGETPLSPFFTPRSVAVVGATDKPGSVGRSILQNLIASPFGGIVYPVNPKRLGVMGIRAYASVPEIPDPIDLAVIATPAPTVPDVISQCVQSGVRAAIVISAGFKEIGPEGLELEQRILAEARKGAMRIIGPNCLGLMCPITGLNASFASTTARPGRVAFLSQSGALCTSILDWSLKENVGFSAFVSIGSMLDVGWGDLIEYLGDDHNTSSIVIYMETIGDARSFISAAGTVALNKPIIVIKAGRTEAAAKAAASHTGSLTGSDEVLDAAFRRCGVLRVHRIADLFNMAEVLSKQPRPKGPRLTIITNAGGPGVLATDTLIGFGGELAPLSPETMTRLNELLPSHWSHSNPIDVLGDADPERIAKAVDIAAKDSSTDGLLVVLTPQAMTNPTAAAGRLAPLAKLPDKPLLASLMGGNAMARADQLLNEAGIPTYSYPDAAAAIFTYMWQFSDNLRALYETPTLAELDVSIGNTLAAERVLLNVREAGRTILTEMESKLLLSVYGIPTVDTYLARTADDAARTAEHIGFPVVLKLHSETLTHKTDVGGVVLNLQEAESVHRAFNQIEQSVLEKAGPGHFDGVSVQAMIPLDGYELILGSSIDPQFGPVLLFGSGGQLVEVWRDRALGLPPLTSTLARRMMERTRILKALKGVRGRGPVNLEALEHLMVRFSRLVIEQPMIKEVDINPLLVSENRMIALDARVIVHDSSVPLSKLPRPAIRPYPIQYVGLAQLRDGERVLFRPVRPEDEPLLAEFFQRLSDRSVSMRYFQPLKASTRSSHDRMVRICHRHYDREISLIAEHRATQQTPTSIHGLGSLSRMSNPENAEFALLVDDAHQKNGLGTELLRRLINIAREEGIKMILGSILRENHEMIHLCQKLKFEIQDNPSDNIIRAQLNL